jgi:predicted phosphodiesterase
MKILAISDMHNNVACVRKLRSQERNDFDVIAIAGDVGSYRAMEIFNVLKSFKCPIVYVYGNWDHKLTHRTDFGKDCHLIHLNVVKIGALLFSGFSDFPRGRDPVIKRIPKHVTGTHYVQRYRDALVDVLARSKADLHRTVILTHERVTRLGTRLPGVLLYLYGHIHTFAVSDSQGSKYVNVSALDRIIPVLPLKRQKRRAELTPEERRWVPLIGDLRHVNAGNYAVITVGTRGDVNVECRLLQHAYKGWGPAEGPKWFAAPLVPEEAKFGDNIRFFDRSG